MSYNPDWEPIRNKLMNAYADAWAGLFQDAVNTAYGTQNASIDTSYQPGFLASLYASGDIDAQTLAYYIDYVDPQGNLFMGVLKQMGVYDDFAKELTDTKWVENIEYIVDICESEEGCSSDPGMQRVYDKWIVSGQPTTKDGMISDDDYDKYILVPNTENDIRNILRNEGYNEEDIDELINSIVDNDDFYGSTVLANVLRDLGYYEAGNKWDVRPIAGSPCTADDGTIGAYNDSAECISKGIGSEGDPCGYRQEGQKDASGNCVGGEENCDNPTYAADYVEDCSEFGVCEDGTLKTDEDGTNCSEYIEPLTEEEKLVRDYGQEAVDKAKEIYNGVEDWVEGTIEDPMGAIKGILDQVYSGMSEECKESNTNKPDDWWKDCTNLSVLGQIPGLPIPLPPGTIDVNTTVRDLEDAAKEAGKTLEDIFNPACTGTPAEIQECENRTISDIIGDWASDVWDSIKGAWEDLEDKTEEGLLNILIDSGYNILSGWIFTQIKDAVSTENPLAFVPLENCVDQAWLEQASPEQKALCNDVVNCEEQGLTGGYVRNIDLCGPPVNGYCEDGVTIKDNAEGTNCDEYSEFGFCEDNTTKKVDELGTNCEEYAEFGLCADGTKKVDELGTNCEEYAEFGFCEDESTKKVDAEGTNCSEYTEPFDCSSVGRKPPESGEDATSANDCGSCIDTSLEPNNAGVCEEPGISQEEQDCLDKGRVWNDVTETCEDNCKNTQHVVDPETGECGPPPFVNPGPDEATCTSRGKSFVPADETAGTPSSCGDCVEEGWTHEGVGTNCVDPNPDPNNCEASGKTLNEDKTCGPCAKADWNPVGANGECVAPVECWDGSTKPTEAECPEKVCDESSFQEEVVETTTIPYGQGVPRVQAPTYTEVNGVCTKTTYEVIVADPTQQQCEAEGKALSEDGKTCVEPTPCTNGATLESGCEQCEDGSSPSDYEGGKCGGKLIVTPETCGPETFTAERTVEASVGSGEVKDPTVEYMVENGECTKVTIVYVAGPVMPQVCGPDTVANTVNLTETLPYGSTLPAPQTTYGDVDGVCTATVTTYVAGPPNCTEITEVNYEDCGYVQCPEGSVEPYATSSGECYDPVQPCEDPNRIQNEDGSCSDQCNGDLVLQDQGNGSFLCGEPPCGPNTVDQQVEQNVVIPFGEPLPESQTSYEDDGTQCVATTVTYTQGPEPQDCASQGRQQTDEFTCGECLPEYQAEGDRCIPKEQPDCASQFREQTDVYTCGECLEGYTLADDEVTCRPKTCEDSNAKNYGEIGACGECEAGYSRDPENPDSLCTADTTVVDPEPDPDPEPCPDGRPRDAEGNCPGPVVVEDPCDDAIYALENPGECGEEETCENGATDYPECTQCADGSLPDANLGCGGNDTCDNGATDWPLCSECPDGTPTDPDTPCSGGPDCTDPDYAAANPEECTPGPECVDCTCPEYAAANPEECLPSPPPPPEGGGGGGGGGAGGQEKREPIEFGISADPELLARKQFPITDYLSGLFTGNR